MIMDFTISKSKVSGIIIIIIYVFFLDSAPSRLGLSTQYCIKFNYGQTRDELNITERSLGLGFEVQTCRRRMPQMCTAHGRSNGRSTDRFTAAARPVS